MHATARCSARVALIVSIGAAMSACGSVDLSGRAMVETLKPYRATVVQGNFVSREQVQALQPGMSRQQVRDLLGTPLVTSLFHANRWDYVFTLKKQGEEVQTRKLVVFFEGDEFVRSEGDEMPTEAEFVATLGSRAVSRKVPVLEATEAQLERYPAPERAPSASPAAPDAGAAPRHYPPLESSAR